MTKTKTTPTPAMEKTTRIKQLDLFSEFIGENSKDLSNSMPIWDFFPKYFLSYRMQADLRNEDGMAEPYSLDFYIKDKRYKITLKPTSIKSKDGSYKSYFPGPSEEIIEEALKRLATRRNHGRSLVSDKTLSTWVFFSYKELRDELKRMNHSRDIPSIKKSLEILSDCRLQIESFSESGTEYHDSILPTMMLTSRKDYLQDSQAQNAVMLSPLITESIINGDYYQFNYDRYNKNKPGLARWLFRLLSHRWRHVKFRSFDEGHKGLTYTLSESAAKRQSGFLLAESPSHRREKLIKSLDELVRTEVIRSYTERKKTGPDGTIEDYVFELKPTKIFEQEQIESNIRRRDITVPGVENCGH